MFFCHHYAHKQSTRAGAEKHLTLFARNDSGEDLVEYALLVAFVSVVGITVISTVASYLKSTSSGSPTPHAANDVVKTNTPLSWNVWADEWPGPTYKPLTRLQPETEYTLVIHLAGMTYQNLGVSFHNVSRDLNTWSQDWLRVGVDQRPRLQLLLLPDTTFFELVDTPLASVSVDLKFLREWIDGAPHPLDPAALDTVRYKRQNGQYPPYVFGEAVIRFRTTTREGVGAIALSIWSDRGRPLDEVHVKFCVASSRLQGNASMCRGEPAVQESLEGIDSLRVAREGGAVPNAALHFVELDGRGVVGVFRENNCASCEFIVWELGKNSDTLRRHLSDTTLQAFGPSSPLASLTDAGRGLYNLLFPDDGRTATMHARQAFQRFVAPELNSDESRLPTRSIFVRSVLSAGGKVEPLQLPLGLLALVGPSGRTEFLGFRFRIEAPLDQQSYRSSSECITRWFLAVPPANSNSDDPLATARSRFEPLLDAWKERTRMFSKMPELRTWLLEPTPAERSAALVVLSHHDRNSVYFEQNDRVTSDQVAKRFDETSILILNGCSTGSPMATELLKQFNQHGVPTTIASYVAIRPDLAGDFLATLGEVVNASDAKGVTIADAFLRTVQSLRLKRSDDTAAAYGPRALGFTLLGNGAVRICPPENLKQ
jgi:Flp pilus assembly pilin Flp